jgi:6-pyruvoyltetrahydropterin/6-carboxytetrahydropterin synthase
MIITRRFEFDSGHKLKDMGGKEKNLHGHRYFLEVSVKGEVKDGIVFDISEIKRIVNEDVVSKLDHNYLNDLIENPTMENIVIWIWGRLNGKMDLFEVKLWETPNNSVTYRGE